MAIRQRYVRRSISLVLAVALALTCVTAASAQPGRVDGSISASEVTTWTLAGFGWSSPKGVAVTRSGNVVVLDSAAGRVRVMNPEGSTLAEFGGIGTAAGRFRSPAGVAVDTSGNIYVADTGNHRIQKFSASGRYLAKYGARGYASGRFNSPNAVAVDRSGNIYVADTGNHRIQKLTASGRFLSKFGLIGSKPRQFRSPAGVAVDHLGNIYVADTGNHRIQKFDSARRYLGSFGSRGSSLGQLLSPKAITVDAAGSVYIADTGNHRVEKVGGTLVRAATFGASGTGAGQLRSPGGACASPDGSRLYVADTGNRRVQVATTVPFEADDDVIGATRASSWPIAGTMDAMPDLRDTWAVTLTRGTRVTFTPSYNASIRVLPWGATTAQGLNAVEYGTSVVLNVNRTGTYYLNVVGRFPGTQAYTVSRQVQTKTKATIVTPKLGAAPIRYPNTTRITGRATTWDGRPGPRTVEVFYTSGTRTWTENVAVINGSFSKTYRPDALTFVKVRVLGDDDYVESAYTPVRSNHVIPLMTVSGSRNRSVRVGQYLTLEGTLRPAHDINQRLSVWGTRAGTNTETMRYAYVYRTVGDTSYWRVRIRMTGKGTWTFTVRHLKELCDRHYPASLDRDQLITVRVY